MSKVRAEKLLIIKPSSLGDLVQMTPAVEMLAEQRPELELSLLTEDDGYMLFSESKQFSNVWHLQRNRWCEISQYEFTNELQSLVKKINAEKYDWVVNLHHSLRSALLMQLLSPSKKIGLTARVDGSFRERSIDEQRLLDSFSTFCPPETRVQILSDVVAQGKNRSQLYKDIFRPLGIDPDKHYDYRVNINNDNDLLKCFGIQRPYTVLATGNSWQSGRWPVEYWVRLIEGLEDRKVILLGNKNDVQRNSYIEKNVKDADICNLTGKTNVKEFAQLISFADALIGNDSSAAHLAAAFSIPSHVLFGSSPPELCAPLGPTVKIYYEKDICPIGPCCNMTCQLDELYCMQAHVPRDILDRLQSAA